MVGELPALGSDTLMDRFNISIIDQAAVISTFAPAIIALKSEVWPYPAASQLQYLASLPATDRHLIAAEGAQIVGYLRLTRRTVVDAGQSLAVLGVSTVCIAQSRRGAGLGAGLMGRCNELLQAEGALGLLRCEAGGLVRFYAECGWSETPVSMETKREDDPSRSGRLSGVVMTFPATTFRSPAIRLVGDSF